MTTPCRYRSLGLGTMMALTGAFLVGAEFAAPTPAQARGELPIMLQITNNTTGDIERPRLRMREGLTLTFVSDGDVMGLGSEPGHREVYYHDVLAGTTVRVTNTAVGESYYASRQTDDIFSNGRPDYIVFTSTGEHGAGSSNPEGNPELFMWIPSTNEFHQLTFTGAGVVNEQAYPSDSGQCIVFQSTGDLDNNPGTDSNWEATGFANPDGSAEVFMMNMDDPEIFPVPAFSTQMSNGPAGTTSSEPSTGGYIFARQCQNTPYLSDHDQFGEGVTGTHIYNFKKVVGESERLLNKARGNIVIGDGFALSGDYRDPHISSASQFARGPNIVFATDADLWQNQLDGFEMFKYRAFHPRMTQQSYVLDGGVRWPTVSDGGGWMTYASDGEVLHPARGAQDGRSGPFNADGNYEIFQIRTRRLAWQLTDTINCENTHPHQMGSGEMVAFRSTCDIVPGQNASGVPQVFLYRKLKSRDPLLQAGTCRVEEGCCNVANGCFQELLGVQIKAPNRFCENRRRGCRPRGL